ncbi:hypothetical protein, partial [Burkholderia sp. TSV86]|uniref:hypothetical protein n=1 Tax=Burkholderia sp. TSV86 TaxID=1385594 RepID=UPI001E54014F
MGRASFIDRLQYNYTADGVIISLPAFVQARMYDGVQVFPPSQLSLFGVDFTMTSTWLISFPQGVTSSERATLTHSMSYLTASHSQSSGNLIARLQKSSEAATASYQSPPLELSTYALEPVLSTDVKNGATIGFTVNPFIYPPTTPSSNFKIVSAANTLQVCQMCCSTFNVLPTESCYAESGFPGVETEGVWSP